VTADPRSDGARHVLAGSHLLAVVRWRLALSLRTLRILPPAFALVTYAAVTLLIAPQDAGSCTATSAVVLFVLAVWMGSIHRRSLTGGRRDITVVAAGPVPAALGELVSGGLVVIAAAAFVVAWPTVLHVVRPVPSAFDLVVAFGFVAACGLAGLALALLVDSTGLGTAARFVAAAAIVTVTLARAGLEHRGPLARLAVVLVPPVMDGVRALLDGLAGEHARIVAWTAAVLVWAAVAALLAGVLDRYLPDQEARASG
jgi:hypothetical protein